MKSLLILATLTASSMLAQTPNGFTISTKSNSNGQVLVTAKNIPPDTAAILFTVRYANDRVDIKVALRMPYEPETFATFVYEPSHTHLVEAKAETLSRNGGWQTWAQDIK